VADITWAMVQDFAAHLSAVDSDAQTAILAYVNDALVVSEFDGETGPTTKMARIYLAAHFGELSLPVSSGGAGGMGPSGPIASESGGGLSRSYAAASPVIASYLNKTNYGQSFLTLVRMSPARAPVVL
jgi:hypothetical protein